MFPSRATLPSLKPDQGRDRKLQFEFTVRYISGEEGRLIAQRQALAIRNLLLWVKENQEAKARPQSPGLQPDHDR
jgi:hypothetical protein